MVLVLDNYDSFTYNLVQYLGELGAAVVVRRNDQVRVADVAALQPDRIVLSPGPGRPEDAGIMMNLIHSLGASTPILGVCLGHQAIGAVFGGRVVHGSESLSGDCQSLIDISKGRAMAWEDPTRLQKLNQIEHGGLLLKARFAFKLRKDHAKTFSP